MTIIAVVDIETTGTEPTSKLVEFAGVIVHAFEPDDGRPDVAWSELFNPEIDIPPIAMAIHHITDEMVTNARPQSDIPIVWLYSTRDTQCDVLAAHNAKFDRQFLPTDERPWICTYKCAIKEWPDAPAHSNQVLRYHLGLKPKDIEHAGAPHRALYDAIVTAALLRKLLETNTVEQLIRTTELPLLLPKVKFGKYIDKEWKDVPKDYLDWILRQGNFDEDVVYTAQHWRNKR